MLRPRQRIEAFGRAHPGCWDALARVRAEQSAAWPGYVFATAEASARGLLDLESNRRPDLRTIVPFPGLAAWRTTQQVFRFAPDLFSALIDTPITGPLPGELFRHLPAWSVYLETPGLTVPGTDGLGLPLHGVFAWLDWPGCDMLCIGWDTGADPGGPLPVSHVTLRGSLEAGLSEIAAEWTKGTARGLVAPPPDGYREASLKALPPILSLLLYLCADQADYARPPWPAPVRIKGRPRLVPPAQPTTIPVGERLGAALRRAQAAPDPSAGAGTGSARASPIPHVRRAHWHTFLRGPREGERTRDLRWLPPIGVRLALGDDLAATVRPVRAP